MAWAIATVSTSRAYRDARTWCKAKQKVIFVHGCFWHLHRACGNCRPPKSKLDYWKPKLEGNAARDKRVRQQLRQLGWRCLVVWECELDDFERLARRIAAFLEAV